MASAVAITEARVRLTKIGSVITRVDDITRLDAMIRMDVVTRLG